jgi:hypothetical protein
MGIGVKNIMKYNTLGNSGIKVSELFLYLP